MNAFQSIKGTEIIILKQLKEWGILDQIAYLTYPEFWVNDNAEDLIIKYQRSFCERLKSPNELSYMYLSMSSYTGKPIDGVPSGGILLALRTIGQTNSHTLVYMLPRKAGGIRTYMIKNKDDELELCCAYPVCLFDRYLAMLATNNKFPLKTIQDIVSLQLIDTSALNSYMSGADKVDE
jgi:hypothetical protein